MVSRWVRPFTHASRMPFDNRIGWQAALRIPMAVERIWRCMRQRGRQRRGAHQKAALLPV